MNNSTQQNLATYNARATELAQSYDQAPTPVSLPHFVNTILQHSDKEKTWVLEFGCAAGRDSHWMAENGFNVTAVDGSEKMLEQAHTHKKHKQIQYLLDTAPALSNTIALNKKYDIILVHAFIFHLNTEERQEFYNNLISLIKEDTYIYVTLRHGPAPKGCVMFDVFPEELEQFAKGHGANFTYLGQEEDKLNREGVSWDHLEIKFSKNSKTAAA